MRLAYAILADAAEVGLSGKISMLGGDFETIYVTEFPSIQLRLSLVVKLLVQPSECDVSHSFSMTVLDPDGVNRAPEFAFDFTPRKMAGKEDRTVRYFIVLPAPPVLWVMPGQHVVHLFVDNQEIGAIPIEVEQLPNTSTAASSE